MPTNRFSTSRLTWIILGCLLLLSRDIGGQPARSQPSAADYRQVGLVQRQQGDLVGAIASFQQAVELDPQNVDGRVLLGWTQHLARDGDAAVITLRETFYQNPVAVPTLNALGIVYLVNGDLTDAAVVHTWAALLQSDNEIAYYNLSLTWDRLGYDDWAIATAERATQLEPENPHPWIALALAHWDQGDRDRAGAIYQTALSLDGRYSDRMFLSYLEEAAFSPEQITKVAEIQDYLLD